MKTRLDQYLCQNGFAQSRERAKALIMSGIVFINEQKADKAGDLVPEGAKVEVRGHDIGYVSRGGLKLEKAMEVFPISPRRQSLHGHRGFHRRLYRLHAPERGQKGLCGGCGLRPAGLETAHRRAGGQHGADQHPPCDSRRSGGFRSNFSAWMCLLSP